MLIAGALLMSLPTFAASLDDLRPATCQELDTQIEKGGRGIELFNSTSQASIAAFKSGDPPEGCRLFSSVRSWVARVIARLDECELGSRLQGKRADAATYRDLRAGFADLESQFVRIDRREACTPGY